MQKFTVRPYSNIAQIGLQKLDGTLCELNEETGNPDGILVRSTKLDSTHLTEDLKAISRAGAGVNNIPFE